MKKLYLSLLTLAFLFIPLAQADFTDVTKGDSLLYGGQLYTDAILNLQHWGIVEGLPDGSFGRNRPVQRDEALKMIVLAVAKHHPKRIYWEEPELFPFGQEDTIQIDPPCFDDFTSTGWFEPYACWYKLQGWAQGYEDGKFHPEWNANFAEIAKLLVSASGDTRVGEGGHWAQGYIEILNRGMIPPTITRADQVPTRGEVAQLIDNYLLASYGELQGRRSNTLIWNGEEYVLFEYLGESGLLQYLKKDGKIYTRNINTPTIYEEMTGANPATFKVYPFFDELQRLGKESSYVGVGVAVDSGSVFAGTEKIPGSWGPFFEFFEYSFFEDAQGQVYGYGKDLLHAYLITCWDSCWPQMIPESDENSFEPMGNGFSRDQNQYYYLAQPIELPVDPNELEFLTPVLGKQGGKVYYFQDDQGEGWQLREFKYIGVAYRYGDTIEHYMTDGQKVFILDTVYTKLYEVAGADAASFKLAPFVDGLSIALDNTALYKGSAKIEGSAGGSFKIIGESFEVVPGAGFYGGDDGNIYYIRCLEGCDISSLINGGDIDSLKYLGEGYAADANQVYYAGDIIDVDRESFTYLGEGYVADKNGVYYHHANNVKDEFSLIPEADLESFQLNLANDEDLFCTFPFAKDGKNIFLAGRVMNEIDHDSFEFLDSNGFFFKDKNGFYRLELLGESHLCEARSWAEIKESKLASADLVLAEQAVDYFETYSADLSTLQVLNPHYFSVENRVYYMDDFGQIFLVKRADKNSFETLIQTPEDYAGINHSHLAKDLIHSYHNQDVIPLEIDVASFEYDHEKQLLQDKNRQYALYEIEKMLEECVGNYIPVCGEIDGELQSFRNSCLAKKEGSTNITEGLCTQQETIWAQACFSSNPFARWRPEWNYCEDIDEQTCNEIGGKEFDECGSACDPYNDDPNQQCPAACTEICFFE